MALDGVQIGSIVILAWVGLLLVLYRYGFFERYPSVSLFGPFVMWRTRRGRRFIDRLARRKRFWIIYGNIATAITIFFTVLVTLVLVLEAYLITLSRPVTLPAPELIVGIPGINPLIPVSYGIVALALAIIVHEGGHAVLMRVAKIKIRSMGLLFFVIPVGAFVEPDEHHLKRVSKMKRMRLLAAGPSTNIIVALLSALIFAWGFMASVEPSGDGAWIESTDGDMPAAKAGITPGTIITRVEGAGITDPVVRTHNDFNRIMLQTHANETVEVYYRRAGKTGHVPVVLADKGTYFQRYYPSLNEPSFQGVGFMGVQILNQTELAGRLAHPYADAASHGDRKGYRFLYGTYIFIAQPFFGLQPMPEDLGGLYEVKGPLATLPAPAFWILANTFYWLFWLNLMVGATNTLTMIPLDGHHYYKDWLDSFFRRVRPRWGEAARERAVRRWSWTTTGILGFLILWQIVGPRVVLLF